MTSPLVGVDVTTSTTADPVGAAQEAERLGFDFVSASDHPAGTTPSYETWTLLTWIAAATSRVAVASRVLAVPLRNPALLAKMAESLDRLSGGRVILGLGGGYADAEFRAFGLPVPSPREKVDGLEDAVRIARRLWTERAVTHDGRVHRIDEADIEPKPGHRIPVWLGTFGNRALAVTGRVADGWLPSLGHAPADRLPAMRDRVLAAAADAGRDPAGITCALNMRVRLGPDGDGADLTGTAAGVAGRLRDFTALGFTAFNLQAPRDQWERLAGEVVPALRQPGRGGAGSPAGNSGEPRPFGG
jgi:alkanesulfonate monooxygenase SsuD/methylene tetrahydromethanopterin reductase-like flavin-dependent oxidoreductase (luciferase family)